MYRVEMTYAVVPLKLPFIVETLGTTYIKAVQDRSRHKMGGRA